MSSWLYIMETGDNFPIPNQIAIALGAWRSPQAPIILHRAHSVYSLLLSPFMLSTIVLRAAVRCTVVNGWSSPA